MKSALIFIFLLSSPVFATRNLIIVPNSATYTLESGYVISLKSSDDRKSLESVVLSKGESSISVPAEDFSQVTYPVLNSVKISGGSIGEENIHIPKYVTIGFGAHYCELRECPKSITFVFKNGTYLKYFISGGMRGS